MRVLHICSYYIGNELYMNLIKKISLQGIYQEVFIPIRDDKHFGKNQLSTKYNNIEYYYRNILKTYDKFFYFSKIKKQMKEIERLILSEKNIDYIHAHTVFSDGGTAYKLYEKYGIKYIVNIRNTDINKFYKYGIHLRPFMYKILSNASAIVFISHAYKKKMLALLPPKVLSIIESKCHVFPNGIDDFWHRHAILEKKRKIINAINLLIIGKLDKNKNLGTVIKVCAKLYREGINASLHVVGNGPLENEYKRLCKKIGIENKVIFHGYISGKKDLLNIMDGCDIFIMPSRRETFGLVFIEAMSRGIPVIYTEGQGIDGFFDEGLIGFSVEPLCVNMIVVAIKNIIKRYDMISLECISRIKDFSWDKIANKYIDIYKENDTENS